MRNVNRMFWIRRRLGTTRVNKSTRVAKAGTAQRQWLCGVLSPANHARFRALTATQGVAGCSVATKDPTVAQIATWNFGLVRQKQPLERDALRGLLVAARDAG